MSEDTAPEPVGEPRPAIRPRWVVAELAALTAAVGVTAFVSLRLWNKSFRVPFVNAGDEWSGLAHVVGLRETGWWFTNPRLGAPFQLESYDFPHGADSLQVLFVRIITLFTSSAPLAMNLYYLATYVLVAWSAYLVWRYLRFSPFVAGSVALLYAFLPFHFWHGTPHIYRSGYFAAPLTALVLLWLSGFDGGLFSRTGEGWREVRFRRRRLVMVGLAIVVTATTDTVAAAFAPATAAIIGTALLVRRRDVMAFVTAFAFGCSVIVAVVAVNIPTLIYQIDNGANTETVERQIFEQEIYGLKIAAMLLPSDDHPIDRLAALGENTRTGPIRSEGGQALGVLGVAGLLGGVLGFLGAGLGRQPGSTNPSQRRRLVDRSGGLILIMVVLGVPGGVAYVMSVFGFEEIRTWNRIVVYIAFLALTCTAAGFEWLARRVPRATPVRVASVFVLAGVTVAGLADQTPGQLPNQDAIDATWERDLRFFEAVEDDLASDPDPMVFMLPIVPYPEPEGHLYAIDYRHMLGVVMTDQVSWSYGAIRGRPESTWQFALDQLPADTAMEALAAIGFDGVYVDSWAMPDRGASTVELLGQPDIALGRNLYFSLDDERAELERDLTADEIDTLAQDVLHPPLLETADGFVTAPGLPPSGSYATSPASFALEDVEPREVIELDVVAYTAPAAGIEVRLMVDDEVIDRATSDATGRVEMSARVTATADQLTVRLDTDGGDVDPAGNPGANLAVKTIEAASAEVLALAPTEDRLGPDAANPFD